MRGQTLIEILVALSVIAIIATGITVTVTNSLSNVQYGKNQNLATSYAQEGMEILRQIRNADYNGFKSYTAGDYCLGKNISALQSSILCSTPNIDNIFIRTVEINQSVTPECSTAAKVKVTVSWTDGKCQASAYCHKSELNSCMSTINPIQAP